MQASNASYCNPSAEQLALPVEPGSQLAAACRDCVVTESGHDDPWAPLCRQLRRPALLLADAVETIVSE